MAGGGGMSGELVGEIATRRGGVVAEEVLVVEAAVPLSSLRVEDPELRLPPRWAEPVAGDGHRRSLADDVAPEPDPRSAGELQAEAGRFGDGRHETSGQAGWFEGDEERFRAASKRGEVAKTVRDAGRRGAGVRTRRQVDDEEVDRPTGEQGAGDGQTLVERFGGQHDEPVQPDAASDRFDRVEASGEVEPGNDRAVDLSLRGEAEGEGRLAGARLAPNGDAGAPRQAAGPEDRIEGREPGPDDPLDGGARLLREWRRRQCSDDPRSCRAMACLEGRQSSRHIRGKRRHGVIIEHMFYWGNLSRFAPAPAAAPPQFLASSAPTIGTLHQGRQLSPAVP
jgi:hypothetical protein